MLCSFFCRSNKQKALDELTHMINTWNFAGKFTIEDTKKYLEMVSCLSNPGGTLKCIGLLDRLELLTSETFEYALKHQTPDAYAQELEENHPKFEDENDDDYLGTSSWFKAAHS